MPAETLREEIFALTYCMKGITYDNIESMSSIDRNWYLNRLYKQLKKEADEMEKKQPR